MNINRKPLPYRVQVERVDEWVLVTQHPDLPPAEWDYKDITERPKRIICVGFAGQCQVVREER